MAEKTVKTWTTWQEFEKVLHQQFGDIDAKVAARNRLEKMKQYGKTMTDYWNKFRLVAMDTEFDDATLGRLLLRGINKILQDTWASGEQEFMTIAEFAQWAIRKENCLNMIKHIQETQPSVRQQEVPRHANGTFKEKTTSEGGEAMDLDASNRKKYTRLPDKEFQRKSREGLCLKCRRKGHLIKDCRRDTWVREMTIKEEKPNEQLKEEGPQ